MFIYNQNNEIVALTGKPMPRKSLINWGRIGKRFADIILLRHDNILDCILNVLIVLGAMVTCGELIRWLLN